jgi:hypothetical protein
MLASWHAIMKVVVLAVVLDTVFQIIVLHWFYPLETLIVVLAVAVVPYLLVRGLFNALARIWRGWNTPPPKP